MFQFKEGRCFRCCAECKEGCTECCSHCWSSWKKCCNNFSAQCNSCSNSAFKAVICVDENNRLCQCKTCLNRPNKENTFDCNCDKGVLGLKLPQWTCPHSGEEEPERVIGCKGGLCCCLQCPACQTKVCDPHDIFYDVTFNKLFIDTDFANGCVCDEDIDEDVSGTDLYSNHCCCCSFGEGFLSAMLIHCVWCVWSRRTRQYELHCENLAGLWDPECYGMDNYCTYLVCQLIHSCIGCIKVVWSGLVCIIAHTLAFLYGLLFSILHCVYSMVITVGLCLVCKCKHECFCKDFSCLCFVCKKLNTDQFIKREIRKLEEPETKYCSCLCCHFRCATERYDWCDMTQRESRLNGSPERQVVSRQPKSVGQDKNDVFSLNGSPEPSLQTPYPLDYDSDENLYANYKRPDPYVNVIEGHQSEKKFQKHKHLEKSLPVGTVLHYGKSDQLQNRSVIGADQADSRDVALGSVENLPGQSTSQHSTDITLVEYDDNRSPSFQSSEWSESTLDDDDEVDQTGSPLYVNETLTKSESPLYINVKKSESPLYVNEMARKKVKAPDYINVRGHEKVTENKFITTKGRNSEETELEDRNVTEDYSRPAGKPGTCESKSLKRVKAKGVENSLILTNSGSDNLAAVKERKRSCLKQHSETVGKRSLKHSVSFKDNGKRKLEDESPPYSINVRSYDRPQISGPSCPSRQYYNEYDATENEYGNVYYDRSSIFYENDGAYYGSNPSSDEDIYSVPYCGKVPRINWHDSSLQQHRHAGVDLLETKLTSDGTNRAAKLVPRLKLEPDYSADVENSDQKDVLQNESNDLTIKRSVSERLKVMRTRRSTDSFNETEDVGVTIEDLNGSQKNKDKKTFQKAKDGFEAEAKDTFKGPCMKHQENSFDKGKDAEENYILQVSQASVENDLKAKLDESKELEITSNKAKLSTKGKSKVTKRKKRIQAVDRATKGKSTVHDDNPDQHFQTDNNVEKLMASVSSTESPQRGSETVSAIRALDLSLTISPNTSKRQQRRQAKEKLQNTVNTIQNISVGEQLDLQPK